MTIYDLRKKKSISDENVYLLLKRYGLYDEVESVIYHLNIKYIPYYEVLNVIAPNQKLTPEQSATFIYNNIKLCDVNATNYNKELDEKLTLFGASYTSDNNINYDNEEIIKNNYNSFMSEINNLQNRHKSR